MVFSLPKDIQNIILDYIEEIQNHEKWQTQHAHDLYWLINTQLKSYFRIAHETGNLTVQRIVLINKLNGWILLLQKQNSF